MAMLIGNNVSGTTPAGDRDDGDVDGRDRAQRGDGALGVGIFCGDRSMCMIERNTVSDTRPDRVAGDRTRAGFAILAHFESEAEVGRNIVARSPGGIAALVRSQLVPLG